MLSGRASFDGVVAVTSNDVWAVGAKDISSTGAAKPLIEHFSGTSWSRVTGATWSIIVSPKPGELVGVTALSDGTVGAVGSHGASRLILQN